jgi:hypothetical protein
MRDWTVIPFPADHPENPWSEGTRVGYTGTQEPRYRTGKVTGWARDREAHATLTRIAAQAQAAGRELTSSDYECLVDAEGPLIWWDHLTIEDSPDWFPGQSTSVLLPLGQLDPRFAAAYERQAGDAAFLAEMARVASDEDESIGSDEFLPGKQWRELYGRGPILSKDVREFMKSGLFAGTEHIATRVHYVTPAAREVLPPFPACGVCGVRSNQHGKQDHKWQWLIPKNRAAHD